MQKNVFYENGSFNSLDFSHTFGKKSKVDVTLDGQKVTASPRFWGSLTQLLKSNTSFPTEFKLFSAKECLTRLQERYNNEIRFCIDQNNGGYTLHGISLAKNKTFDFEQALSFLEKRYGSLDNANYKNGIVSYTVETKNSIKLFNSDDLKARKVLELPIDNFRDPQVYTEFLRLICLNGMRASSREFIKTIKFGNEVTRLHDVFDTYERSKSFKLMEDLFNQTCKIQATASELKSVMNTIKDTYKITDNQENDYSENSSYFIRNNILEQSGLKDSFGIRVISDLDILNKKQLDGLPTQYTAFDLINILTELRTHVSVGENLKKIDKKVGELLTKKDWILKDIDLPQEVGIDFENHSIGTFFSAQDRANYKSLYNRALESSKKVNKVIKELETENKELVLVS
jgi:hypothetical protein